MKSIISKRFLWGFARALGLNGTKEWPDLSDDKLKDYRALRSDWENVGKSIRKEARNFEKH